MTLTRSVASILAALLANVIVFAPSAAMAQGFEFGEEEAEEVQEDAGEDEGGMTFGEGEVEEAETSDTGPPQVAVVAIPGPNMDESRRSEVQATMFRQMEDIPGQIPVGAETVLPGLKQRNVDTCVTEPLCLADVGAKANVDRILLARVKDKPDGLELAVDYFDVNDKLFMKYHSETGLGGTGDIVDAVEPSLKSIFDIRDTGDGPTVVEREDTGTLQNVLAWGTAGLAVASLGAGIFFGIDASSQESDLQSSPKDASGVYDMTQVEAKDKVRAAEDSAVTANIFYGLAIGLGLTSGLLFYIKSGSDVASEEELQSSIENFEIGPTVHEDGYGVGLGFDF